MNSQHSQRLTGAILLAAIGSTVLMCAAADYRLGTSEGVLLLRNGSILRGQIARQGDHYVISFEESGSARLPASNIERVCDDLEQVYRYKLSRIDGSLAARVDLARWCIQQSLLSRAADQVLAAEAEHGNSPRLEAVHQRLLAVANGPRQAPGTVSSASAATAARERAELLKELAPGLIERFTADVQPLLLNRCANSGCHSAQSGTSLVLVRPSSAYSLTRRLTERNLASTLSHLDRERPLESPLLQQARLAHGGAPKAGLAERDIKQFELLTAWVRSARMAARAPKPPTVGEPNGILLQSPVKSSRAAPEPAEAKAREAQPITTEGYQPVDPFDPEVFNRRYHPSP